MSDEERNRPPRSESIVTGGIIICIGVFFILGRYFHFLTMGTLWPLFMMIPVIPIGLALVKDPRKNAGTLIPLTILVFLTVYFLWLNFTSWNNVSRTWPNFVLAPGLGFLAAWLVSRERGYLVPGGILVIVALALYVAFVFRIDWSLLTGLVLIVVGLFVILVRGRNRR